MWVHTKKHPINENKIMVVWEGEKKEFTQTQITPSLMKFVIQILNDSLNKEEYVLSNSLTDSIKSKMGGIEAYKESAISIKGYRSRENVSQTELSKLAGITQSRLSAIENAKSPVGKRLAKKFASIFNTDYSFFLSDVTS